jgi:hypothetical protein
VQFPLSLLGGFTDEKGKTVAKVACRDVWLHAPCAAGGTLSLAGNISVDVPVHGVRMLRLTPKTTSGLAQAAAAKHEVSAEDAVAAAKFAAMQASKYRTALAPPKHAKKWRERMQTHQQLQEQQSLGSGSPSMGSSASAATKPRLNGQPLNLAGLATGVPMRGVDPSHTGRSPYKGP